MTDFKKIEKAAKIYEKIKSIDAKIIEIDKFALIVANKETTASFELKVLDLEKEAEEKVQFDEDGSIAQHLSDIHRRMVQSITWGVDFGRSSTPTNEKTYKSPDLSATAVLNILGVLLSEYNEQRQSLINRITKLI